MKNVNKLITAFFVFVVSMIHAQTGLPPQPVTPGGGTGGTGTGAPPGASPIDMYVYVLAIAAVLMIVSFARKYKTQKI